MYDLYVKLGYCFISRGESEGFHIASYQEVKAKGSILLHIKRWKRRVPYCFISRGESNGFHIASYREVKAKSSILLHIKRWKRRVPYCFISRGESEGFYIASYQEVKAKGSILLHIKRWKQKGSILLHIERWKQRVPYCFISRGESEGFHIASYQEVKAKGFQVLLNIEADRPLSHSLRDIKNCHRCTCMNWLGWMQKGSICFLIQ